MSYLYIAKGVITLVPGDDLITPFSSSLKKRQNELMLSPSILAKSLPKREAAERCSTQVDSSFIGKQWPGIKKLAKEKH